MKIRKNDIRDLESLVGDVEIVVRRAEKDLRFLKNLIDENVSMYGEPKINMRLSDCQAQIKTLQKTIIAEIENKKEEIDEKLNKEKVAQNIKI